MARSIWSGSISFGLVQIPIGIYPAEKSSESLSFTLLDKQDMSPIGYKQVNKSTGEEVPKERRVKGYEVEKGEYVLIEDEDFKRANAKKTETIDIHSFVDAGDIPWMRFERPYYLKPDKNGLKPYALLREALENTKKVAIATIVLRNREQLAAIVPYEGALVLEMLRFDYELADVDDVVDAEVKKAKVTAAEVQMAETLVNGMAGDFDTSKIHDTYRDDLLALIEERRANPEHMKEPLPEKPRKKQGEVIDIMSLLKKSVAAHRSGAANSDIEQSSRKRGGTRKAKATRTRSHKKSARRSHG